MKPYATVILSVGVCAVVMLLGVVRCTAADDFADFAKKTQEFQGQQAAKRRAATQKSTVATGQASGEPIGPAADVFDLAITVSTGEHFTGELTITNPKAANSRGVFIWHPPGKSKWADLVRSHFNPADHTLRLESSEIVTKAIVHSGVKYEAFLNDAGDQITNGKQTILALASNPPATWSGKRVSSNSASDLTAYERSWLKEPNDRNRLLQAMSDFFWLDGQGISPCARDEVMQLTKSKDPGTRRLANLGAAVSIAIDRINGQPQVTDASVRELQRAIITYALETMGSNKRIQSLEEQKRTHTSGNESQDEQEPPKHLKSL